jgi:hypothetical protein
MSIEISVHRVWEERESALERRKEVGGLIQLTYRGSEMRYGIEYVVDSLCHCERANRA